MCSIQRVALATSRRGRCIRMSRPAGWSDEEDSEYESFGYEPIGGRNQINNIQEHVKSPEEKLFEAVKNNDLIALTAAIAEGADVHVRMRDHSPIMEAALEGRFEVMEFLIQKGANINDESNMTTVLMQLCISSSKNEEQLLRCLRLLLEHGADPMSKDWTLSTPLIMATRSNHILLVTQLLEIGCDVNSEDPDGYTPVMLAVQNGNAAMVKLLLESGANTNVMDRRGNGLANLLDINPNPEIAALLGIELDDDTVEVVLPPSISNFKRAMLFVPKKNDRMYGFHEDAVLFVKGINLYEIAAIFEEKNVQLAELLTWSDEDWEQAGVRISYYRKKLALCVKKYHERPWGKDGIPRVASVIHEDVVDPFFVFLFLLDFLRVMHISSATSLYTLRNCDRPLNVTAIQSMKKAIHSNSIARQCLQDMRRMFISHTMPPDLITVDEPPKPIDSGFCLKFVGFIFKLYIFWRLPSCSNI